MHSGGPSRTRLFGFDLFFDFLDEVGRFPALTEFNRSLFGIFLLIEFKNGNAFEVLAKHAPIKTQSHVGDALFGFSFAGFFLGFRVGNELFGGFCLGSFCLATDDLTGHVRIGVSEGT